MKTSELRSGLKDMEAAFRKWGSRSQANELEALYAALAEFDDLTVAELANRIRSIGGTAKPSTRKSAVNHALVDGIVAELRAATNSTEAFDRVVERVRSENSIKKAAVEEIVRKFAGALPGSKTSRDKLLDYVRTRRLEMRRQEGLGATIDRMFGRI